MPKNIQDSTRERKIDILKGILIVLVVIGHYNVGLVHDIIFLFHMPLFFVVTGLLYKDNTVLNWSYIKKCVKRYIIPYVAYMILLFPLINRRLSVKQTLRLLWGGRAVTGVWWYMTCLFASLIIFTLIRMICKNKKSALLVILAGGIVAVIESHIISKIPFLQNPGIPWNIDVALLAVVYIAIGFYFKKFILCLMRDENKKYDNMALFFVVIFIAFAYLNYKDDTIWYFDMKPVCYNSLVMSILIPIIIGVIICRIIFWFDKIQSVRKLVYVFEFLGQMTVPIMYIHVPVNQWKNRFGYGLITYIVLGIGLPFIFTKIMNRNETIRALFSLPARSIKQNNINENTK